MVHPSSHCSRSGRMYEWVCVCGFGFDLARDGMRLCVCVRINYPQRWSSQHMGCPTTSYVQQMVSMRWMRIISMYHITYSVWRYANMIILCTFVMRITLPCPNQLGLPISRPNYIIIETRIHYLEILFNFLSSIMAFYSMALNKLSSV